jgi:hypothetical protein
LRSALLALFALLLFGAPAAGAATTLTDAQGDAVGGAADITQVVVSNDFDGNVTFKLTIPNRTTFTPDDAVLLVLDTDKNASTGFRGQDFALAVSSFSGRRHGLHLGAADDARVCRGRHGDFLQPQ